MQPYVTRQNKWKQLMQPYVTCPSKWKRQGHSLGTHSML